MAVRLAVAVLVGALAGEVQAGGWEAAPPGLGVAPGSVRPGTGTVCGHWHRGAGGCAGPSHGGGLDAFCTGLHSTGDMPQHLPYGNPFQAYHFFRPYNSLHIAEHQQEIQAMGGDPREPYDNRIFQEIYREVEASTAPVRPVQPLLPQVLLLLPAPEVDPLR